MYEVTVIKIEKEGLRCDSGTQLLASVNKALGSSPSEKIK